MTKNHFISATIVALLSVACTEPADPVAPSGGSGGATASSTVTSSSSTSGGTGGSGGADTTVGTGGSVVSYPMAVGAAYNNSGDSRVVLVDATGLRSALFNPNSGTFESADDVEELEGGIPLADVVAAATVGSETFFFDSSGSLTVYDSEQAAFSTPEPVGDVLEDIPLTSVGAAFSAGQQLFVFNQGGTSYAAYNVATETWSPIYSFVADFGGGGAPIAAVGAAYALEDGSFALFDKSGTSFCYYVGGGAFSDDFDIEELGDGNLSFEDE